MWSCASFRAATVRESVLARKKPSLYYAKLNKQAIKLEHQRRRSISEPMKPHVTQTWPFATRLKYSRALSALPL
jgi:hypothetical protein